MNVKPLVEIGYQTVFPSNIVIMPIAPILWCRLEYPEHPDGCPNVGKCHYKIFEPTWDEYALVYAKFNFAEYKRLMKVEHPGWTDKQCGCVLYWQSSVKKLLTDFIQHKCSYDYVYACGSGMMGYPSMEAAGINVFETMKNIAIELERNPQTTIYLVCLLCRNVGDDTFEV
jgi:hypothetical protein